MRPDLKPRFGERLRTIVADYDALIIDQWGVLHEGAGLYEGVLPCLKELASAGKQTLILTNSSKSDAANVARLEAMGLPRDYYTHLLSSAQILHDRIGDRRGEPWAALGRRAFVVATGSDDSLLDDLDLERVSDVHESQFVILLSVDGDAAPHAHHHWLIPAAELRLPLVGPSRDARSVASTAVFIGLGALCDEYERLGGTVTVTGKPEKVVYQECTVLLGKLEPSRVLVIGDQMGSDVAGANRQGFHSALVGTGAAAAIFAGAEYDEEWSRRALDAANEPDEVPQLVLRRFCW